MGSKRVGLARTEALLEGLKREINLNSSLASAAGAIGTQGPTKVIIGKNGCPGDAAANPFAESATQLFDFGTKLQYGNREYRYAGIGGAVIAAGECVQAAPLVNANHRDCAAVATTALNNIITVTLGNTATTANQYAEGYIHIQDGPGQGLLLKIKSHPAASGTATCAFSMYDPLYTTALTTSSKVDLILAPYNDVIVAPNTFGGPIIGVSPIPFTADYYGWIQTAGPASVEYLENPTGATDELGGIMIRADAAPGAVMGVGVVTGDTDIAHQIVGTLMVQAATTEQCVVWLTLS